jgi:hypothetical protein
MEATKAEIIQKGLVKKKEVTFGSNRTAIFLTPTKLGLLLLKNSKQSTGLWERLANSSFEHRLYAVLVAYGFKNNGYNAFIEKTLNNGKRLDVLVFLNNRRIGIEIELDTTVDVQDKLEYLSEVDELVILAKDKRVLRAIERKLVISDNVTLHLLRHFLNELRSKIIPDGIGEKPVYRNNSDSRFDSRSKHGAKGSLEIE